MLKDDTEDTSHEEEMDNSLNEYHLDDQTLKSLCVCFVKGDFSPSR